MCVCCMDFKALLVYPDHQYLSTLQADCSIMVESIVGKLEDEGSGKKDHEPKESVQ